MVTNFTQKQPIIRKAPQGPSSNPSKENYKNCYDSSSMKCPAVKSIRDEQEGFGIKNNADRIRRFPCKKRTDMIN